MNKVKSFFGGLLLLIIVFIMIFAVALIYKASERSTVKTYIFQMGNYPNERVGELRDINDISVTDLRNRLIQKYVSEYFKVIPQDPNVTNRPILMNLSSADVFNQWENEEARTISEMSAKTMFRIARVYDDGIAVLNNSENIDYEKIDDDVKVYYIVKYVMYTWSESNVMKIEPEVEQGTVYLEASFKPGIRETIHGKKVNIRKYLESGASPIGLFKFKVTNIGDKAIK